MIINMMQENMVYRYGISNQSCLFSLLVKICVDHFFRVLEQHPQCLK